MITVMSENKQKQQIALKDRIKEVNKGKKKEHFLVWKMWLNYLVSLVEKDRGRIPDNIGNKMLITNNLVITKAGMTSYIQIETLSLETPQFLISRICEDLRKNGSAAVVDAIFKNEPYVVNINESGLKSRRASWEMAMERDDISDYEKETAARCLYTVEVIQSGAKLMKTRLYLAIRAKTGAELTAAEKIIYRFLTYDVKAVFSPVVGDLKGTLSYIAMSSGVRPKDIKDIKAIVNSEATLAQMLTCGGSLNDKKGLWIATNVDNYSPYNIDFESITSARNIYITASAGEGKTVLAINMCASAIENGWAVCIQDIKGNEFNAFTEGTGGYIVSLRETSPGYINSFIMHADETTDEEADVYFKERFAFSKRQLSILSSFETERELNELNELLEEFLGSLYIGLGVLSDNRSTWSATETLTPFEVYRIFTDYVTAEVQAKYSSIIKRLMIEYRMYLSKEGSKSYLFTSEFNYLDILRANTLMFDFGLLQTAGQPSDKTLFRLKFEYMRKLNAEFVSYKYKQGVKVFCVLEESQVVANDANIMRGYIEAFTLRRSQGQTTLLIGNSVAALLSSPLAQPLIENIKAIVVGKSSTLTKKIIIETFALEEEAEWLDLPGSNNKYANAFLFINKMQPVAVTPMIKVLLEEGKKYAIFSPKA